jgi:hypothetical protein
VPEGDDNFVVHAICIPKVDRQHIGRQGIDIALRLGRPCLAVVGHRLPHDFCDGVAGLVGVLKGMTIEAEKLPEQSGRRAWGPRQQVAEKIED